MNAKTKYCVIKTGKRSLFKINLMNYIAETKIELVQFLLKLEQESKQHSIETLTLSMDDRIFTVISALELKKAGESLRFLKIALTPRITRVDKEDTKTKPELLEKFHNDPLFGGHCGQKRLLSKLKLQYFWTNMAKDVYKFVKNCKKCQTNKTFPKTREKLTLTKTPQTAFDLVSIDTIGPLMTSNHGNKYAVTIICDLTKYIVTISIPDNKANTVAKAIFENFILIYGPMKQILSDRGTEYVNNVVDKLCKLLKIPHVTSTSYHHRTLGTVERSHRTFNEYLRSYINNNRTDWDDWLSYLLL